MTPDRRRYIELIRKYISNPEIEIVAKTPITRELAPRPLGSSITGRRPRMCVLDEAGSVSYPYGPHRVGYVSHRCLDCRLGLTEMAQGHVGSWHWTGRWAAEWETPLDPLLWRVRSWLYPSYECELCVGQEPWQGCYCAHHGAVAAGGDGPGPIRRFFRWALKRVIRYI